jgi:hypothetical protein
VAIVDGGVAYQHPDLAPNVWMNSGEDLNGNRIIEDWEVDSLDNDMNGFIDDFWGWDWIDLDTSEVWPGEDPGPPDNDPSDFDGHGTHCAGDACAVTNNMIGVASPGCNSQIMCLRAGYLSRSGQGYVNLYAAMGAIYYAIDMGAEVISMSFGGPGGCPPYFTQALNTANDAGLVLVAAAGNESTNLISYPAGYDIVIAVAATAPGDVLADFSNFGTWITVCAPGDFIYSTLIQGYGNMSGTSMATPVTAGVCALVKGLKPEWNSVQVGDWIAQTADNIDLQNPGFVGMMGGGRINMANAVDLFVCFDSLWVGNSPDLRLDYGVQEQLFARYHKQSGTASNVSVTLSCDNPNVSIQQATFYIGNISTGESGDNGEQPFLVRIWNTGNVYEILEFNAHFSGSDFEFDQILNIPAGRGQILIINADQNNTQRTSIYYESALIDLGYVPETKTVEEINTWGGILSPYEAVLLFSGSAENNILSAEGWLTLQDYFDAGGKLIISGQNIAQDLSATLPYFLSNFLQVNFLDDHSNDLTIVGTPGNPSTNGYSLVMAGGGGAWNQNSLDVVEALTGAESYFIYNTNNLQRMAGVRVQSGEGDMFFCSFGIEGINDSTTSANSRADVLSMMMAQFGIAKVEPEFGNPILDDFRIISLFPNPFNSNISVTYELAHPVPLDISVYDVLGRRITNEHIESVPIGNNRWQWVADAKIGSGVYFIELKTMQNSLIRKALLMK